MPKIKAINPRWIIERDEFNAPVRMYWYSDGISSVPDEPPKWFTINIRDTLQALGRAFPDRESFTIEEISEFSGLALCIVYRTCENSRQFEGWPKGSVREYRIKDEKRR